MRRLFSSAAAMLLLAACQAGEPPQPTASVENAWLRLPAAPGRPGALYFRAEGSVRPIRIVGITSPAAARIELHETATSDGVSTMARLQGDAFGPGEPLLFEPGGKHAMVFGLDPELKPGDTIPVTLTFDPAPPVTVEAELRGPGGMEGEGH